ncbi:hypothetical protein CSIRO_2788 [Bradyrhizobiaceae bacterium SG-6C]|nr:hypothetical protein CSIRO_2788 [Bradyrhizobiaceae bacterium SG-6C]
MSHRAQAAAATVDIFGMVIPKNSRRDQPITAVNPDGTAPVASMQKNWEATSI